MSTSKHSRARNATTPQRDDESASQQRERLWDELIRSLSDQDPDEQRRQWLEFQRAIDEDREGDQKYYPCPDE